MKWTEEKIETLRALAAEGRSAKQIAVAMGIPSRNAVIGAYHRYLSPEERPKQPTKDRADAARKGLAQRRAAGELPPKSVAKDAPKAPRSSKARAPAEAPPSPSMAPVEAKPAGPVTLFTAGMDQCRFPLWALGSPPAHDQAFVCGAPVAVIRGSSRPYCHDHFLVCRAAPYVRPPKPKSEQRPSSGDRAFRRAGVFA